MLSAVLGAGAQACAKYPKLGGKTHQSCPYNGGPHRVCDNMKESTNSDLTGDQKMFPEGNERREGSLRLNWGQLHHFDKPSLLPRNNHGYHLFSASYVADNGYQDPFPIP